MKFISKHSMQLLLFSGWLCWIPVKMYDSNTILLCVRLKGWKLCCLSSVWNQDPECELVIVREKRRPAGAEILSRLVHCEAELSGVNKLLWSSFFICPEHFRTESNYCPWILNLDNMMCFTAGHVKQGPKTRTDCDNEKCLRVPLHSSESESEFFKILILALLYAT